jgi:uncharacterized protein YbcI
VSTPEDSLQVQSTISEELLQIHQASYGRGAGRARTYVLDDAVVCFMDDLELLPNEEFLIDNGHADAVLNVRLMFQQAVKASFSAAVERATGRKVISFVSQTMLDPNYSVEIFRLAPQS